MRNLFFRIYSSTSPSENSSAEKLILRSNFIIFLQNKNGCVSNLKGRNTPTHHYVLTITLIIGIFSADNLAHAAYVKWVTVKLYINNINTFNDIIGALIQ